MATPESRVKATVRKELDRAEVYYFMPAANGYGRAGIPDFVCCINGYFLSIECKAGANKPTALQEREMENIRKAGGMALVIWEDPEHYRQLGCILAALKLRNKHD